MADEIKVTLDLAGFGEFEQAARAAIETAVEHAADAIVDQAQPVAPVLTGALRDSIQAHPIAPLEWEVEVGVDYAAVQEFGSVDGKRAGRAYFTPAVEAERARFAERIAAALAEAMKG